MKRRMSIVGSLKDVVVARAMRLMSDPRLTKIASNPRVVNAAMKAINVGGSVKIEIGKATRLAAGVLGIATEEEMATLRSSVQTLEDSIAVLEAARSSGRSDGPLRDGDAAPPTASAPTDRPG